MANRSAAVDQFLLAHEHPLKTEIEAVRAIILASDDRISEQIKWNAPSFGINGEDRVTFKLYPPKSIQLVFHCGVKSKDSSGFHFDDTSGLLKWVAADRALVTLRDMQDVTSNTDALSGLVRRWMEATTDRAPA